MKKNTQYESRIFRVERLTYETSKDATVTKDVVRHPGSVVILPILADDSLCLIRNRRITVDQRLIEAPAGTLEPPESPHECATRELTEETGYQADQITKVLEFYAAPGILDEKMHLFVARGLRPGPHAREIGEEIENHIVSLQDSLSMIQSGAIRDAKTIVAILFYQQFLADNHGETK